MMPRIILSSSVDGELIRYAAYCLEGCGEVERYVTVTEPEYRAKARAGRVARLGLRCRMYLWHPIRLFAKMLMTPSKTAFFVTTNPFFLPGCAALFAKLKGHRVIHVLYDLFPDALEEAELLRRGGLFVRILGVFPRWALKQSHATVFLGECLRAHAEGRWGAARRGYVIPVILSSTISDLPSESKDGAVEIHYGGQLGWMHDAGLLADLLRGYAKSMERDIRERVRWSFRISGAKAEEFSREVEGLGFEVGPTLPVAEWRERALKTEVGLVSLSEGGARVCLPSKTYGMMACGMAILAVCPAWSDLGRLVASTGAGWVVDTSGVDRGRVRREFEETVRAIAADPEARLQCRRNAWQQIRDENRRDREEGRWIKVVEELAL